MIFDRSLEYQVLPVPFHTLSLCGVWCPDRVESWFKHSYLAFTITVILLEILLIIQVFIHFILIIWRNEFDLTVFFMLTSLIIGTYKGLNILLSRESIVSLLTEAFEDYWRIPQNDSEKKILQRVSNGSWRVHLFYALSLIAGVFIKIIGPMMKFNSALELPTAAWYPYDINKPLYFWISYVQQMFVGTAIIFMHIGADTILTGFMIQLCTQLKLLKHRLHHLFEFLKFMDKEACKSLSNTKMNELMKRCISAHQFTYSYSKTLNDHFFGWLLSLFIVVIPNLCITVYAISVSEFKNDIDVISSVGFFTISLIQIYLPCWYGNEVMIHSLEIGSAVYKMDWINLTPNMRKVLIVIMIRSTKPIELKASYIIKICIRTFLSILKSSYSVLTLLKHM